MIRLISVEVGEVGCWGEVVDASIAPRRGNQYGHLAVTLYRGRVKCKRYVHHLVAQAFLPRVPGKPLVCHGPQGVTCNHADNLRWGD